MSNITTEYNSQVLPKVKRSTEKIRQQVDNRHWQLFETRLKHPLLESNQENYTKPNDYHIIERYKTVQQFQQPIQPEQRWKTFCCQLTDKSKETDRVMSIFHNIWIKDWNKTQKESISNENTFLKHLSSNEHDKKVIMSILHQTA